MISSIIQRTYYLIPSFVRRDFFRKLIALFFAVLVYLTVSYKTGQDGHIQGVALNITYPSGIVCLDESIPKVTLKIKGASERSIKMLTSKDFVINVKVEEKKVGEGGAYPLKIDVQDIKAPVGIRVMSVEPGEIMLTLDRNTSKSVKVQPRFVTDTTLPDGYTVGNVKLSPPEVTLTGPSTLIKKIDTIGTEPIPLDKTTLENFDYSAQIALKNKTISVTPPTVLAQVEVIKEDITMDFKSIPIKILIPSEDKKLKAEFVTSPTTDITITGPKSKVKSIKPEQIKAYVDISAFSEPGAYNVDIGCWFDAPDIKIINIFPAKIQVKLVKK